MILTPTIKWKDLPASDAIEAKIAERVGKLDRFYERIMGCRVTIEQTQRRHHQGRLYNVRIDLTAPGSELVVNRTEHEDLYIAVRDAFEALERKLEEYARQQRGTVKTHSEAPLGRITKLFPDRGYGFIETADGREIYFHRNSVIDPDFERLRVGSSVVFLEEQGTKGPQAARVAVSGSAPA